MQIQLCFLCVIRKKLKLVACLNSKVILENVSPVRQKLIKMKYKYRQHYTHQINNCILVEKILSKFNAYFKLQAIHVIMFSTKHGFNCGLRKIPICSNSLKLHCYGYYLTTHCPKQCIADQTVCSNPATLQHQQSQTLTTLMSKVYLQSP